MAQNKYYSDLNLTFKPHPVTGDLTFLTNEDTVKRSLKHIAEMLPYDIPFEEDYHGQIRELLFELPSDDVSITLQSRIKWAFNTLEPRVNIKQIDVKLSQDETGYDITLYFTIISLLDDHKYTFVLERIR